MSSRSEHLDTGRATTPGYSSLWRAGCAGSGSLL